MKSEGAGPPTNPEPKQLGVGRITTEEDLRAEFVNVLSNSKASLESIEGRVSDELYPKFVEWASRITPSRGFTQGKI